MVRRGRTLRNLKLLAQLIEQRVNLAVYLAGLQNYQHALIAEHKGSNASLSTNFRPAFRRNASCENFTECIQLFETTSGQLGNRVDPRVQSFAGRGHCCNFKYFIVDGVGQM